MTIEKDRGFARAPDDEGGKSTDQVGNQISKTEDFEPPPRLFGNGPTVTALGKQTLEAARNPVTMDELRDWLSSANIGQFFSGALDRKQGLLGTQKELEEALALVLDMPSAIALAKTFMRYRTNPPNLRFDDAMGVFVLGKGATSVVYVLRRGIPADVPSSGPAAEIAFNQRRAVFTVLKQFNTLDDPKVQATRRVRMMREHDRVKAVRDFYSTGEHPSDLSCVPHIVREPVLEGKSPSFEFEYAPGYDLGKLLHARGLTPMRFRFVCELGKRAAWAMSLIHQADPQLIHRDLKPDNYFLGDDTLVRTLDYGLVKHEEGFESKIATQDGAVSGTPEYIAPEQAAAEAKHSMDVRTDVLSLGVMLARMLTGQFPYPVKHTGYLTLIDRQKWLGAQESPELRMPSPDDPHVQKDPKLLEFWRRVHGEDLRLRSHVDAVMKFIQRMIHPDIRKRSWPQEVLEFFHPRSAQGQIPLHELNSPEAYASAGLPRASGSSSSAPEGVHIPSRYGSPLEMLNDFQDGAELVEGKEEAYDFVRDLDVPQESTTEEFLPKQQPSKLKRGVVVAVGGITLTALLAAGLVMMNRKAEEKTIDPKQKVPEPELKQPDQKQPEPPKGPKNFVTPSFPRFMAFDYKRGLLLFDRENKEYANIPIEDLFELSSSSLPPDSRKSTLVYAGSFNVRKHFQRLVDDLRPDLKRSLPDKEGMCYLIRHPTERALIFNITLNSAFYLEQDEEASVPIFLLHKELKTHEGARKILATYEEDFIDVFNRDEKRGNKLPDDARETALQKTNETIQKLREKADLLPKKEKMDEQKEPKKMSFDRSQQLRRLFAGTLALNQEQPVLQSVFSRDIRKYPGR